MQENRARPSLLNAIAPTGLSILQTLNQTFLSEELNNRINSGIEKGVQIENDEQLRILNERKLVGDLKKQVIQMRESSYKYTEEQKILIDEDEDFENLTKTEQRAYTAGKWLTVAVMRLARKV